MQRKSVLSICIAMALSGNTWAETELSEKKRVANPCPANISVLTDAQKAQLPVECLETASFMEEQWGWVVGGVAAAVAVGIAAENNRGGTSWKNADNGGDNGDDSDNSENSENSDNGDNGDNSDNSEHSEHSEHSDNSDNGNNDGDDDSNQPLVVSGGKGIGYESIGVKIDVGGKTIIIKSDSTGLEKGTGTVVNGDKNTINNEGNINAATDGTGFAVTGNENTINNTGATQVSEGGTGTQISGNNNILNQIGNMEVGDFATGISVNGDGNHLNFVADKMSITGQQATGLNITGEGNAVSLTGNMVVDKDQTSPLAAENFYQSSTGINVSGNNNTITLDGQLQVIADTEKATHVYAELDGSQERIYGVVVTGDNNRVDLTKGIQLTGETNAMGDAGAEIANQRSGKGDTTVISVDGASSVYVSGNTTIDGDFGVVGFGPAIKASNGGYIELTEDSTFNTSGITALGDYGDDDMRRYISVASVAGGGTLVNNGSITSNDLMFAKVNGTGSQFINNGTMTIKRTTTFEPSANPASSVMAENGGTATNKGIINAEVSSKDATINEQSYFGLAGDPWTFNAQNTDVQGMSADGTGSTIINDSNAMINVFGTGDGMVATQGATAINKGNVVIDSLWVAEGDTSTTGSEVSTGRPIDYGVGMAAGSTNWGYKSANNTAINQGTITVINAGVGMAASNYNGNQVINQGTINLEKDERYDAAKPLYGMAAYGGAMAINDTTGVININAENGMAFYSDGNSESRIINLGKINIGEGVPKEADNSSTLATPIFDDGSTLDGTITLTEATYVLSGSKVSNTGTVDGSGRLCIEGTFDNQSTGIIDSPVSVANTDGVINNSGAINGYIVASNSGKVINNGNIAGGAEMWGNSRIINSGIFTLGKSTAAKDAHRLDLKNNSVFENAAGGVLTGDNNKNAVHLNNNGTFKNDKGATMNFTASSHAAGVNIWGGTGDFINDGTANTNGVSLVASHGNAAADKAFFWNQDDGVVNFTASQSGQSAVSLTHNNYVGVNDGTMNISGTGAVGMKGSKNAQLVNNGTINLGTEGTTESGMVAMQLDANATADAVIENNGAINIYASDSYAFSKLGANGRIVNNGTVTLAGEGSGLIKQDVALEGNGTGGNGTETHAASYTLPTDPTAAAQSTGRRSSINQYTVGTSADGSAGTLTASHVDIQDVNVDTGFTAGTADTSVTFNDVFVGEDIQGEQNITSASVVWTAEGEKDTSGNVDVIMTKNAYADVAGDASVNSVANALDAAYTSNELYNSLNLATSAELASALKQISGSKATGVSRDARILSNRFDMLADTAPVMNNGLAFNVVAKGDKRAELGNDITYDMLALRQSLAFGDNQTLSMEYGIARLDGNGNAMSAGDNGVTGGYSQFFGLKHSLPLMEGGLNWDNALRYDVHNFDSSRAVRYGDVNKTANADTRQQYMEFRTEGSKAFKVQEALTVTPFAGLKMRHTMEDGYSEKGAGDFNLNMSSSSETAVDAFVGLKLNYAGVDGWAATASLEGGPNLSYAKSKRTASLAGARGQTFSVDDAQQGGGMNGQAMAGVKYSAGNAQFTADAFQWQEDGVKDRGFMLNYKYKF